MSGAGVRSTSIESNSGHASNSRFGYGSIGFALLGEEMPLIYAGFCCVDVTVGLTKAGVSLSCYSY
jgi:hypothetical protein